MTLRISIRPVRFFEELVNTFEVVATSAGIAARKVSIVMRVLAGDCLSVFVNTKENGTEQVASQQVKSMSMRCGVKRESIRTKTCLRFSRCSM